jgi:hypothetical protein
MGAQRIKADAGSIGLRQYLTFLIIETEFIENRRTLATD